MNAINPTHFAVALILFLSIGMVLGSTLERAVRPVAEMCSPAAGLLDFSSAPARMCARPTKN